MWRVFSYGRAAVNNERRTPTVSSDTPTASRPSGPLSGRITAPGDKSISHRAIMLGGMADGVSTVSGLLEGADIMSTANAMRALGAVVERMGEGAWRIEGVGARGLGAPVGPVDCGNAGTGVRLLMGAVAGYGVEATFTGDESLRSRPMRRITDPLSLMGAAFEDDKEGRLPMTLLPGDRLQAVTYETPKASAQIKSAVLLAALRAAGETTVIEKPSRDHTETMLRAFGRELRVEPHGDGRNRIRVEGSLEPLRATHIDVPGDPSSAAFAVVAALIVPGSDVVVDGVMLNPRRDALYDALRAMGADIAVENERTVGGGERVADIRARHSQLTGITVDPARAADMIDEYPILAVAAAFASGTTEMRGIGELRVKESDRISATAALLSLNGVEVEEHEDGLSVTGGAVPGGGTVPTHHDHRIAMSALVLGLGSERGTAVDDAAMIATSYPDFFDHMGALGATIARNGA